ncbi:MAG TPA: hypothetical protein VKY19_17680 [Ktedonosporobacter sp.]|jgi:hypothetical protein|nr:hypothetical protein [Ktedonosporobacter sp.]
MCGDAVHGVRFSAMLGQAGSKLDGINAVATGSRRYQGRSQHQLLNESWKYHANILRQSNE